MRSEPDDARAPKAIKTRIRLKKPLVASEEIMTVLPNNLDALYVALAVGRLGDLLEGLEGSVSGDPVVEAGNDAICHRPGQLQWSLYEEMEMAMANGDDLDGLLKRMPEIAKAVSAFPEAVQQSAFEALMAAAGGSTAPVAPQTGTGPKTEKSSRHKKPKPATDGAARKTRRTSGSPTAIRDLDLAPKGKTSFKDFVAAKQPKTQHDYNTLSVYYFAEELGVPAVTLNHVFTVYKDMKWREPASLANSLALTASRKRFLDTANLDDIKLTPPGRNHVQYDLPSKKRGE